MSEETVVVVCPNPKCRREIEEPIILTVRSVTPAEEYEACPHCFTRLKQEPPIEQKEVPEPTIEQKEVIEKETTPSPAAKAVPEKVKDSGQSLLKKVKALIPRSNGPQKEKTKKTKEPKAEPSGKEEPKKEPKIEPSDEETPKEEPKTEPVATKESGFSGCPETFG